MDETPAPENIVPITEQTAESASQEAPKEDGQNPIQDAVNQIDITKISRDDIFMDLIHKSKVYAYSLMVAAALLERLIVKSQSEEKDSDEQNPADQAVS